LVIWEAPWLLKNLISTRLWPQEADKCSSPVEGGFTAIFSYCNIPQSHLSFIPLRLSCVYMKAPCQNFGSLTS
jgi:hypothetical protein